MAIDRLINNTQGDAIISALGVIAEKLTNMTDADVNAANATLEELLTEGVNE